MKFTKRKVIFSILQSMIITFLLITSSFAYDITYSSLVKPGDTISWEVEDFWTSGTLYKSQDGVFIGEGVYLPKGGIISLRLHSHPDSIDQNYPEILWNTSTDWYDIYINDTLAEVIADGNSFMTLGYQTFSYLSPVILNTGNEDKGYFDFMTETKQDFNHTSTGVLNETSEHSISYIRTELYSSLLNSTDFTAESIDIYKKTQVISENLTYYWNLQTTCNVTYDLATGLLKRQNYQIKNTTSTETWNGVSRSISTSYSWLISKLVSNYTFLHSTTEKTSFNTISLGISITLLCSIVFLKSSKRRKKDF